VDGRHQQERAPEHVVLEPRVAQVGVRNHGDDVEHGEVLVPVDALEALELAHALVPGARELHWLDLAGLVESDVAGPVGVVEEARSDEEPLLAVRHVGGLEPQERMLRACVDYEKINYLMLMMVDPHVHFHVFPRYGSPRSLAGTSMDDTGWPGPPDLKSGIAGDDKWMEEAIRVLRSGDGLAS